MARQAATPGHNVRIALSPYADAIKASEAMGFQNVGTYVESALSEKLGRDRQAYKVSKFRAAMRDYEVGRTSQSPYPDDFGLAPDFHVPPLPPAPAPELKPFRPR